MRKLRMLASLQRLGTVAAVADELCLSAPGVSTQLKALEAEVGLALTQRVGRRVVLTPAGVALASHGRDILDRMSLAEVAVTALRAGNAGRYHLAAFPSAARTFVADACQRFGDDHDSALELRISTLEPTAALDGLVVGDVDLAVVHSYSNVPTQIPGHIAVRPIGAEPVWLATPRGQGKPARVRLRDYADRSWIVPTSDVTCFTMVERACAAAGFRPQVVAESMDFAVQLALVAAGVGVALIPELTVDHLPGAVSLHRLAEPVERRLSLAARAAGFTDPGLNRVATIVHEAGRTRLHSTNAAFHTS